MQNVLTAIVLGLVAVVAALPLPLLAETDGISQDLLDRFELFRQYSTASGCPNNTNWDTPNTKVTCASGCPLVEAAGAVIIRGGHTPTADIAAYLAVDNTNNLLVLAIRGTSSGQNVAVDELVALIGSDLCTGCLVHEGFYGAWLELRTYLLPALNSAIATYPGHQIITTGHSLGGAIAIIAAAELRNAGMNVAMDAGLQYNFGQPRIGNDVTANYISNQAGGNYRATHTDDPVPRLPDTSLGYRHTFPEYWISRGNVDIGASDVIVFPDGDDPRGNAGTTGADVGAHAYYFGPIEVC
ncbi:MAG: hypothetical protein M1830_000688 [Pleopsidium flavum]|nr:MAG: hypothetical protein M1830_000688 [Pleopsidium flavum]